MDVYLPLPIIPIAPTEDQHILFFIGRIYHDVQLGAEIELRNNVFGTLEMIKIVGCYNNRVLVFSNYENRMREAIDRYIEQNQGRQYKLISSEEFWNLYPDILNVFEAEGKGIPVLLGGEI